MLVSKEPPTPADETWDTGHDQGQKAGLLLHWDVPYVMVKDVPNFEVLSLELETGTVPPSHTRSPGTCPACRAG